MANNKIISFILRKNNFVPFSFNKYMRLCSLNKGAYYQTRFYTQKELIKSTIENKDGRVSTNFKETVKKNTQSAWYLLVIITGVGIICKLFHAVFKELFSSNSVNGIYSKALKQIRKDYRIVEALGSPIKAHGEETTRRRRNHVMHSVSIDSKGKKHMRMQFYLKGTHQTGTAVLEVEENDSGNYEYTYFYVKINDYTRSIYILEDNRKKD